MFRNLLYLKETFQFLISLIADGKAEQMLTLSNTFHDKTLKETSGNLVIIANVILLLSFKFETN